MADRLVNERARVGLEVPLAVPPSSHVLAPMSHAGAAVRTPSFHPTGWALADRVLAMIDVYSGGRADVLMRVFSYLCVGGFAGLVNLLLFTFLAGVEHEPFLLAQAVAAEVSLFANFIPNDRITFRHLAGHARSWWARCARFHLTAIGGTLVTIGVSWLMLRLGLTHLVAQGIAIWVALVFNFTFHHLFTYRHVAVEHAPSAAPVAPAPPVAEPVSMYAWARLRPPAEE